MLINHVKWSCDASKNLMDFDPANCLDDDETMVVFLEDVFQFGDVGNIAECIGAVARAKGMAKIV